MSVWRAGTNVAGASYEYGAGGRLTGVSFGGQSVAISYWPNSLLVSNVVMKSGAQVRMTATRTYDGLNRLVGVASAPSAAAAVSFAYAYNLAGQRVGVTNSGGARWEYQYDYLGQLTRPVRYERSPLTVSDVGIFKSWQVPGAMPSSHGVNAVRRWGDGSLVAGQQFEYGFDEIGNRRWDRTGGDNAGANLREAQYTVNLLNQATAKSGPGYVPVIGEADADAAVKVNGRTAWRKGEYFQKELPVTNAAGAVWLGVTNIAVLNQPAADLLRTNMGRLFVPPYAESLQYDADGNLTNDGQWTYVWDAENRLVGQETTAAAVARGVPRQKLVYGYDWMSRRVSKTVSNYVSGAWQLSTGHRFVYDGWNLVAILDASSFARLATFVWGNDLSGTMQGLPGESGFGLSSGAGGVGGLLATVIHTGTNAGVYFPMYDGNWNVMGYVRAGDGLVVAQYEYGPFGEPLRATGPLAAANPFRFSTKYCDEETGHYYYGYRYYSPAQGRWLSRDPIGENGGRNLYGFLDNDSVNYVDVLGEWKWYNPYSWIYDPDEYVYHPPLPLPNRPRGQVRDDEFAELESWPIGPSIKAGCKTLHVSEVELREAKERIHEVLQAPVEGALEAGSLFIGSGAAKAGGSAASKSGWWQRIVSCFKKEKCAAKTAPEATGFLGSKGFELKNLQAVRNTPEVIGGRNFSAHALEQMQNRGIMPSVVENTIKQGTSFPGNTAGTTGFFDAVNNVRVIVNSQNGTVVTVIRGAP